MRGINRILAAASVFIVVASSGAGARGGETTEKTVARGATIVAKENCYALIVGVDYYPNLPTKEANEQVAEDAAKRPSDSYDLRCCVKDAKKLAAALVEYAGFEPKNVYVTTFQKGDELDPNDPTVPTAANIRRKIDELAGTLSENDMLVVAFSGHGLLFGVDSNDDPEKRAYLCACDADFARLSTFVDRKALLETLEKCRARRKLFIADCCRDLRKLLKDARGRGGNGDERSLGRANPFETGNYGFAQISACREGQEALEIDGGGLFTSALIDGLQRGANDAGELSLTAWFEYAKKQTTERSRAILANNPHLGAVDKKTGERQKEQEPTLYLLGETPGWIFADGLPVDGLSADVWAKADALFDEASQIRGRLKSGIIRSTGDGVESAQVAEWRTAQGKIDEALKLTAEAGESSVRRAKYVAEEARLTKWASTEAKKLAEVALEMWKQGEKGDETKLRTAITLTEESLELNDDPGNRYLLTKFKEKLDERRNGTPPGDRTDVDSQNRGERESVSLPRPRGRKAFLVGADDYGVSGVDLRWTKNDVEALRERLLQIGFDAKDITTLQTGGEFDYFPTKRNIKRQFKEFVESLKPGDLAFIYFSGHGVEVDNRAFFAPIDVEAENVVETSIAIDELMPTLEKSRADFIVFTFDACRNATETSTSPTRGGLLGTVATSALKPATSPARRITFVFGCGPGELCYEGGKGEAKEIKHGFFTLSLLEALDPNDPKGDANRDGVATLAEVFEYASRRTNELSRKYCNAEQRPQIFGVVDFIFAEFEASRSGER